MDMTIRLQEDFKEFLKLLEANEVDYLLVGGYAVGYYGYPRPTGDMDIWVSRSVENAKKVVGHCLNRAANVNVPSGSREFWLDKIDRLSVYQRDDSVPS
ncbi:MAG: hypothetical protein ABIU09_11960 [Pyrinomonadaceae bacterium]